MRIVASLACRLQEEPGVSEICGPLHALKTGLQSKSLAAGGPKAAASVWNLQLARQAAAAWETGECKSGPAASSHQ